MGVMLGFLKIARRYQIPLLLTGGGEPETSFATTFLTGGQDERVPMWLGYLHELADNPRYVFSPVFMFTAISEFFCCFAGSKLLRKLIYPDQKYIPIFHYINWDEETILSVIKDELNWRRYAASNASWRSDCKIALLKNYLYGKTVGFTKNDDLLSNMIREGVLTREAAMERLASENVIQERFVSDFCEEIGLGYHDLKATLRGSEVVEAPDMLG
jgi:hypothetical protein